MPDVPAVHDIATPRRTIGGRCRKWCISAQPASGKRKCAACCMCGIRFTHGEARLQQWGNRETNHNYVHAHCVNGGLGHDHELHTKLADDQEAVGAVTRQRDTITRTAAGTEALLPFAQDPDQASTAAPPDDERDLFGREETLRMDEEIMDFPWFEHVTWDSIKDLRGTTYVQHLPRDSSLLCSKPNMPFSEPSFTTTQPLWPQSQLGKRWYSAAGSFWNDPQSTLLRATAHTFWVRDWSFFGLRTGLLSGPWYVPNVMLLQRRTRRAERTSSKCSHMFAKLLRQRVLVKKDEPQQLPETHHQLLCQPQCQPYSCLKWLSMSLLHSERCHDSVNQDHLACVRNSGMTSAPGRETAVVIAHTAAAGVPNPVLQDLKAGQITPLAKPTGGHRPLFMMSFLRRLALKSVIAAKKESVAKCAGPLQCGVGRPDGANTMIETIQYLAEADNSRVLVALDLKAAFQNVSRRAMQYSIAQTDADLAAVFSKWYTGTTQHRMHNDSA